ncbi:hypothetical protein Tco_0251787 [Tanacetum coccineum]
MDDRSSAVEYPNTHIQGLKRAIHHYPHVILLYLRLKFFQVYVILRSTPVQAITTSYKIQIFFLLPPKVASVLIVRSEMHAAYATYMWNDAFNKRTSVSGP